MANFIINKVFFAYLFFSTLLLAENAQHAINWWGLGSKYKDSPALGWLIITFLIFIYLLARMIKKPLSLYLETRSKDIKHKIEEGLRQKLASEKKLLLYEEKLKSLDQEIEKLRTAFLVQAEAEKKERERLAKEIETRIIKDADDTIKANFERSKNRLTNEVIKNAIKLAQQEITDKKREQIDESLKDGFVNDLKRLERDASQ